jgi:hypothetical protein
MSPHRSGRSFAVVSSLIFLLGSSACDATFNDLRDLSAPQDRVRRAPGGTNTSTNTRVLARGLWEGRAGHAGAGTAELVEFDDGALELRFLEDFTSSGVPGPVVVLSSRESLGRNLDGDEDLELGVLDASRGAQNYSVPILDDGRRVAWVFCKPFGVEVARAVMAEVQ